MDETAGEPGLPHLGFVKLPDGRREQVAVQHDEVGGHARRQLSGLTAQADGLGGVGAVCSDGGLEIERLVGREAALHERLRRTPCVLVLDNLEHVVTPAAALVDIGLPDGNGVDLAAELAALPWGPRVVVTSTDRDAGRALAATTDRPALPFIAKEDLAGGELRRLLLGG